MIKTRTWIIIFSALILISSAACALIFAGSTGGKVANIYRDGECVYSVDLSQVDEAYEMEFSDYRGMNTVLIEPGRISVSGADCPDQVCVKSGYLSNSSAPIVCLPHRLVIRVEKCHANGDVIPDSVSK